MMDEEPEKVKAIHLIKKQKVLTLLPKEQVLFEDDSELFSQFGIHVLKYSLECENPDLLKNVGKLSLVEYKEPLGKCLEWNPFDVRIESDGDQEWAFVENSSLQFENINDNSKGSKNPVIRIPLNNLISFTVPIKNSLLTLHDRSRPQLVTFSFLQDQLQDFINILVKTLNASVSKSDPTMYIVRNQKEVQDLEKSFAHLDLFSDDKTRSDVVWSFIKKFHEDPYETTLCALAKVSDTLLVNRQQRDIRSNSRDEGPHSHGKACTEDYEIIPRGPLLPPRILPPRSAPLTKEFWLQCFDEDGRLPSIKHELIKETIFRGGISPDKELRSEIWKFLLGYYSWNSTSSEREITRQKKEEEYFVMKSQWKSMTPTQEENFSAFRERKSLIEKDVYRTDRNEPFFAGDDNPNLEILQNILMTYVMYHFDLGYVQGMSDLLSPLLVQLGDEVDTFWCFVGFMNKMSRNFDMDQAEMKKQLQQMYCILCYIDPELASHLERKDSKSMVFCFRWLLIWLKREFDYERIFVLWEVLWTGLPCENFHIIFCTAILATERDKILSNNYGLTEILKHINELAYCIDLNIMLSKAEAIYIQLCNASNVPSIIREIIGLKPVPEFESKGGEVKKITNDEGKQRVTKQNGISYDNDSYATSDHSDMNFDTSLNLQYF